MPRVGPRSFVASVSKVVAPVSVLLLGFAAGCRDFDVCPAPSDAALAALPKRLSETGLVALPVNGGETLASLGGDGILSFTPAFELWSDGAAKRRYVRLPEDAVIDTSDMDDWRFPEGTRLWKDFVRDGVRVETRYMEKIGPRDDEWAFAAYVWDGDDAVRTLDAVADANGTPHDVPAADQCLACHGGRKSRVLGCSALQLTRQPEGTGTTPEEGDVDIDALVAGAGIADRSLLSHQPRRRAVVPGNETARNALGMLHANCGHCHNAARPEVDGPRCYDPDQSFDFSLAVGDLGALDETAAMRTAIGKGRPFDPTEDGGPGPGSGGYALYLMSQRAPPGLLTPSQMPPLGTERVDRDGVRVMRRFLADLAD